MSDPEKQAGQQPDPTPEESEKEPVRYATPKQRVLAGIGAVIVILITLAYAYATATGGLFKV